MPKKSEITSRVNHRVKRHELARVRAGLVTEMQIKGVPTQVIAEHFNVSPVRVRQIAKWGQEHGVVEEVRERMRAEVLPKAEKVYNDIFDASPETLSDPEKRKGYELKLKAAKHMADGTGAFRKESAATTQRSTSVDLEGYFNLRRSKLEDAARQFAAPGGERRDGVASGTEPYINGVVAEVSVVEDEGDGGDTGDGGDGVEGDDPEGVE